MIINQSVKLKSYKIPGLGIIPIKNLQDIPDDSILGKGMLRYHSQVCFKKTDGAQEVPEVPTEPTEPKEPELLIEEPICTSEVIHEPEPELENEGEDQSPEEEDSREDLRPLDSFNDKEDLEEYGRTFGCELSRRKTLKNMYRDLQNFWDGI